MLVKGQEHKFYEEWLSELGCLVWRKGDCRATLMLSTAVLWWTLVSSSSCQMIGQPEMAVLEQLALLEQHWS